MTHLYLYLNLYNVLVIVNKTNSSTEIQKCLGLTFP
jgi:hypothetical protein